MRKAGIQFPTVQPAMKPKGKLLALVMIVGAVALAAATGAFTTVTAERTMEVNVADDSAALLQLDPVNGDYVSIDGTTGQLVIDLDGDSGGPIGNDAQGLNPNANTTFDNMFKITNQGSETVDITITTTGSQSASVYLYNGSDVSSSANKTGLAPGTGYNVSIGIDTSDGLGNQINSGDSFDASISISAEASGS